MIGGEFNEIRRPRFRRGAIFEGSRSAVQKKSRNFRSGSFV